jgi:hypothetical protein
MEAPALEVAKAKSRGSNVTAGSRIQTRQQAKVVAEEYGWQMPRRHKMGKTFILKTAVGNGKVADEIVMLKKIRDASCDNLPELVWEPGGG